MTSTRLVDTYRFVREKFDGMVDKTGDPYVAHSLRVAEKAASFGTTREVRESLYVVGLCHDLLEDSDTLACHLIELGVTEDELEAVYNVTNKFNNGRKLLPYEKFIDRAIEGGYLSTVVKFVDVMDNLTRPKHEGFKYAEKLDALAKLSVAMKTVIHNGI